VSRTRRTASRLVFGVILPILLLTCAIGLRTGAGGIHGWHPWSLIWCCWLGGVVITAMLVGAGLQSYWLEGGYRAMDNADDDD
jgi:hypothetical protein